MNNKVRSVLCTVLAVTSMTSVMGTFSTASALSCSTDEGLSSFEVNAALSSSGRAGKKTTAAKSGKKASQTDDTGIKWGVDAKGLRDWRMDAVEMDKDGTDTRFIVMEEPLKSVTFSVGDKYGLYKVSECDITTEVEDINSSLEDKDYEKWFTTEVDGRTVYVYRKAGVLVFTAGAMPSVKGTPGSMTYYKTTVSPEYAKAKLADKEKAKAFAGKEFEDVLKEFHPERTAANSAAKKTGKKADKDRLLSWSISDKELEKEMAAEKDAGKKVYTNKSGTNMKYVVEDGDDRISIYSSDEELDGLYMQMKIYIGRTKETEENILKKGGYSRWMTYEKDGADIYIYKNSKTKKLAAFAAGENGGTDFTVAAYFNSRISGMTIKDDSLADNLADYVWGMTKDLTNMGS